MQLVRAISLRLLYAAISILFVSVVTFMADSMRPGGPEYALAGEKASKETIQRIRHELGLDKPWYVRYVHYVKKAVKLDFGRSYYSIQEPVSTIIKRNIVMTARLAMWAILISTFIGVSLGTIAAVYQQRMLDKLILIFSTFGVTVPNFVLAPLLVVFFCLKLQWLPINWEVYRDRPDFFYLVLPVGIMSLGPAARLTRNTRSLMIDVLHQEFIRFAIAKGVPKWKVVIKHGLRNALMPIITQIGMMFGALLSGSFVVEQFFTLPGIGKEAIEAIKRGDAPVTITITLVGACIFVTANLIVDILLPLLDPRIREAQI